MNRRRFLQGILQSALVVAFLPQIEPLIKLIPPLHRKLTSFDVTEICNQAVTDAARRYQGCLMKAFYCEAAGGKPS